MIEKRLSGTPSELAARAPAAGLGPLSLLAQALSPLLLSCTEAREVLDPIEGVDRGAGLFAFSSLSDPVLPNVLLPPPIADPLSLPPLLFNDDEVLEVEPPPEAALAPPAEDEARGLALERDVVIEDGEPGLPTELAARAPAAGLGALLLPAAVERLAELLVLDAPPTVDGPPAAARAPAAALEVPLPAELPTEDDLLAEELPPKDAAVR